MTGRWLEPITGESIRQFGTSGHFQQHYSFCQRIEQVLGRGKRCCDALSKPAGPTQLTGGYSEVLALSLVVLADLPWEFPVQDTGDWPGLAGDLQAKRPLMHAGPRRCNAEATSLHTEAFLQVLLCIVIICLTGTPSSVSHARFT